jgi:MoxR-like ATPase
MEAVGELMRNAGAQMGRVIVGQADLRDQCLVTLLCRGHALLEGVPGIAKTLAVKTLARLTGLQFQRVQATSDLMPADILGTNVLNMATSTFEMHRGPVFSDLLLVDEVNRMPPRTQAALLECMEERQVTIDGVRYPLSPSFAVFATQNPIEFEGTYPLPEAELDRFLLKIRVPYPESADEVHLLAKVQEGFDAHDLDAVGLVPLDADLLARARQEVKSVTVQESLFGYVVQIARRTRAWPSLSLGASPRAAIGLLSVSKAIAALEGRDYLIPDDVKQAVGPVLRHRVVLKPEADLEGVTADQVLQDIVRAVEVPR